MEYCEGNTLKQLIDRGILQEKPNMIWMLLREILDGLRHMHFKVIRSSWFLMFARKF
jgi:serine/threonine protein kinase